MLKLDNRFQQLLQRWYAKVIIVILVMYLAFFLCDGVIMPWYTRHGKEVKVPDVLYLSSDAAKKILAYQGFHLVNNEATHDSYYPPGFIVFQNPAAGEKVKRGRRIYVNVSRGERIVSMPKLVSLNLSNTRHTLETFDLTLGDIEFEYNSQFQDTIVIQQSVPIDEEVPIGTKVDIVCQVRAVDKSTTPRLIGFSLIEAEEKIEDAKLVLGQVRYQETDQLLPFTVIDQQPEASLETAIGDTVNLIVSKLPDNTAIQYPDTIRY